MLFPYFITFLLRPNAALDYQTFHAEPQSLLSRRDDTCERLRSLRGLRPYEERAEAITPRLNKLCGSARKSLRSSIIYAALRENICATAGIDLHHSKGFMGLGQNRLTNRLNLGDALTKSGHG